MALTRLVIVLAVVLACSACARRIPPEVLQAWVGQPASALEREWGPATRQVSEGDLQILIYEEVARRSAPKRFDDPAERAANPYRRSEAGFPQVVRPPSVYVRSYLFWVDADGIIVRSEIRQP